MALLPPPLHLPRHRACLRLRCLTIGTRPMVPDPRHSTRRRTRSLLAFQRVEVCLQGFGRESSKDRTNKRFEMYRVLEHLGLSELVSCCGLYNVYILSDSSSELRNHRWKHATRALKLLFYLRTTALLSPRHHLQRNHTEQKQCATDGPLLVDFRW